MGKLYDGEWVEDEYESDEEGRFQREETVFRDWIRADGSGKYEPEAGRYHLYISRACPWAHRTAIMRRLKGLTDVVSMDIVDPYMGEDGWFFSGGEGSTPDTVHGSKYLREIYLEADPNFTGRVTVPVLWDRETETIVNNESAEIMRMFDVEFDEYADRDRTYYPEGKRDEVDRIIEAIYDPINNGVYRAGFAESQQAYEEAVTELFEALDHWESVLEEQRYLCGSEITEADWCMFTTLYRFDAVYHTHFKCNVCRIVDYPNLWNYLKELYQYEDVAKTCNMDHCKEHYYTSHTDLNPKQIVPTGPMIDFEEPYDRSV
jgi:putative glutathione S-transferase